MLHNKIMFKKRENVHEIEEGDLLSPKFDNDGLIPVITTCVDTKEILMHGYMNVEALKLTIENARHIKMKFEENEKKFDPDVVYKDQPNPTKI